MFVPFHVRRRLSVLLLLACILPTMAASAADDSKPAFRAGAVAIDITPTEFPVIVNGYFDERIVDSAQDRLMARALVLDDGTTRLAIVVVDNLMIPTELLDDAKQLAHKATGIPTERMLISATHAHSAPAAMGCLGSGADVNYQRFLPGQLAKAIALATENLTVSRIGWTVVQDHQHNHCRRWIFRSDRMIDDPFGVKNVRAHMHPGHQSPNHIGPSGPADPDLSILSIQTADGRPLAVLANYAMHYYGATPLSADFCGRFGGVFGELIGATGTQPKFVGIMSQGTSGDSMWPDYSQPAGRNDIAAYTAEVAQVAKSAYDQIAYRDWVPLAMAEETLRLRRRAPDVQRLAWARQTVAPLEGRAPKGMAEIYAREQIYIHDEPEVDVKLQAIRIGDLGITALPNEVYGITGLKLKSASPLATTFNIELANGAQGYIPPPEQHALGGYTTWPARTAGLEVEAEPKIVAKLLDLLEQVAGKPRRKIVTPAGDYSNAVIGSEPIAYWQLSELAGTQANDATGAHHALYEPGVAFYLPGPTGAGFSDEGRGNRAAHFAGGRLRAAIKELPDTYSVEFWFWNGLPHDARAVTGYLFSRGADADTQAAGDHLGIGGTYREGLSGKLIFFNGNQLNELLVGRTTLDLKTWHHVVLTRDDQRVNVFLNGNPQPEISGDIARGYADGVVEMFLGGRNDNLFNLEGKLDEVAVYDRALTPSEVTAHFVASGNRVQSQDNAQPDASATSQLQPDPPPQSPDESLAMHHVRDGFVVELVAAEPLVVDPVAIAWGADGKLWVVEMADYPNGMDGSGQAGGRVRYLQDTTGDGKYDTSTLFLDGINSPTGILPWHQGVLVTAAPEIFYAEDTDGDGKADVRQTLYSGFFEGNQQLRVNGLRRGLDNWVYCALGSHHGGYAAETKILSSKNDTVTHVGGRDFRIRPDEGLLDPIAGPSQFGRNPDDWGNWFGVQNSYPLWHYVLEDYYTRRNPYAAPPDPRKQLLLPANPKVYPATSEKRFHSFEESGHFTSACSAMIYRDELLFGRGENQHAFTCEPFHNLVHHAVLRDDGVSFHAERAPEEQQSEFFTSEDRWCRPVMAQTGPDGALWIVDMYRYMIEHPQWLPEEGREELKPFYRSGDDRGRIYRIYRKDELPRPIPQLAGLSTEQLVAQLESPNGWQRDVAQQSLVQQQDATAVAPLAKLADGSTSARARIHALCTLDGLKALDADLLERALTDPHPAVRRQAVRLAEPMAAEYPQLIGRVLPLASDPDAKVRLQVACSLGQWQDPRIGPALTQLALSDSQDTHTVAAVMSSLNASNIAAALTAAIAESRDGAKSSQLAGRLLALAVDFKHSAAVTAAVQEVSRSRDGLYDAWQYATTGDLLDALTRRGESFEAVVEPAVLPQVSALIVAAREIAMDDDANTALRASAVRLFAQQQDGQIEDLQRLGQLLIPQTPAVVQDAVVSHLARRQNRRVAEVLLAKWKSHAPGLRSQVLNVLATRKEWIEVLLDHMESGSVVSTDIDLAMRQRLAAREEPELRSRFEALLAVASTADRQEVLSQYSAAATMTGDLKRGAKLFETKCSTCHKVGDKGYDVGPNLVSLTNKTPQALLAAILDPSQAVEPKFLNYTVITIDGLIYTGILVSETGTSITLLGPEDKQQVILRSEVEQMQSSGKSMMPDGFEKELTLQDCADIMAFVAGGSDSVSSAGGN